MKEKSFLALSPRGWGTVLINYLSPVINTVQQEDNVSAPVSHFQPSLMFAAKATVIELM